ncbi:sister-chromatid cohesion 3 [Micractinium conductrix]|uniref:Sister-chromatid cohesion 3 n=1 Tax=Micractinium conductrix TaxID=554055 RepID=A0A2P6V9P0_9CHLO|nr:sister-chromatid cohesion 3 [Micractinium conductrix]|eukprot:PSC70800.1 sister-chromatid cohesion 3 [Micractinium conductrix]
MTRATRQRAAVDYAEGGKIEGVESDSDVEAERDQAPRGPQTVRRIIPNKPRPARKRAAPSPADLEEASLLDIVKQYPASIAVAAKDWVDRYREGRGAATAELLTFLLQACGVDRVLTEEAVEEGEVDALRAQLDRQAQEEGLEDHWHAGGRAGGRAFRSAYLELWDKLVREAHAADVALFDGHLLDRLAAVLVSLNTSVIREFRAIATLTAAQLVTSWTHVSLALGEARDTAQRQLAAEERRKGGKAGADRVAAFRRTLDRCHARVQELRAHTEALFQGIFAHRFRDCSEEIRATVIEGIGAWARLHPAAFLTDQYLKYIAWALSDKDARVRLASVSALLQLYSNRDNLAALQDFTQRFQQRFGELFYDSCEAVAVKGVELNTLLVKLKEAQPSQFAQVYELLADDSHAVRHAVAELVAAMLDEQGAAVLAAAPPPSAGKKGGRGRRRSGEGAEAASEAERQLAGLLQVLHLLANPPPEGEDAEAAAEQEREVYPLDQEVVAQVVDALFQRVPALSDWPLLLRWASQGSAEAHFGDAGLTNLLHLLRDALRKATGAALPGGPADRKAGGREKQQAQAAARQDATLALIKELPALLRKVQTDPVQAAALAALVPALKLEVFALQRQERTFASLAEALRDTLLKHADPLVAKECVGALAACAASGPGAIKEAAQAELGKAADRLAADLASAVAALDRAGERRLAVATEAFEKSGGEEEAQLLFDVRAALARLHALLALGGGVAAGEEEVYDGLHRLLEGAGKGEALPGVVVRDAALSQLLLLMWRMHGLNAEFPDADALADLAAKRGEYVEQLQRLVEQGRGEEAKDAAARCLGDVLFLFSAAKLEGTALADLGFEASGAAVRAFWGHCEEVLRRDVEAEQGEDASAIAVRMAPQRAAAAQAAQLAVFRAVPQHAWLASQLVSQWVGPEAAISDGAVRRWAPVAEVVKETCRLLRKAAPDGMPAIYLDALKAAHARIQEPEEDEEEGAIPPDQEFLALSDRISKTFAGFNSSAPALEHLVVEGTRHAVRDGPHHLSFLEGVAFFVRVLPAARAAAVSERVEEVATPAGPSEEDPDWATYYLFLDCLAKRASKARAKPALKKGQEGGAGTARKAPRKISFAPVDGIEESDEEAEEPGEHIEDAEEEDVLPASARVLPRSASGRRSSRPAPPPVAPAAEDEEEEDQAYEEEEQQEGYEEEEEEEGPEVMPTDEQLALPAGRDAQQPRRQRRLQRMFEAEEEGEAAEEAAAEAEAEGEEDLPAIRGRPHGGSQRQAPAVDPQPQVPARGGEEEEEEDRPARRRRRR